MNAEEHKNKHAGERCFLVGNGTSLRHTRLDSIANEISFGVKDIMPIFDDVRWRPSYYVYTTRETLFRHVAYVQNIIDMGIPSFVWSELSDRYYGDNVTWLDLMIPAPLKLGCWSDDISEHVFTYKTIMYAVMQIASYMGLTEFILLGCDLNYRYSLPGEIGSHFYHEKNPLDYWRAHQINKGMTLAHTVAYEELRQRGIRVFNATAGGSLDVYPRVNLEDIL